MHVADWKRGGRYHRWGEHRIFYREAGTGGALVCVHGFPTASWDWHRLWPELTRRFRVIAPDMLGFGFSDKPAGHAYSFFEQTTLIEALLSALGVRAAHVLAHDYGVTVAQELLARQAERAGRGADGLAVRSVTLLNGGLFPEATHPLFVQRVLKNRVAGPVIARLMSEAMFRRSFARVFGAAHRPTDNELREFWSLIVHDDGLRVAHRVSRYQDERRVWRDRWTAALADAAVPLRLIIGAEDPVSGLDIAARFRQVVADPDVVILDGVGHYPQVEAPRETLDAMLSFLGVARDQ